VDSLNLKKKYNLRANLTLLRWAIDNNMQWVFNTNYTYNSKIYRNRSAHIIYFTRKFISLLAAIGGSEGTRSSFNDIAIFLQNGSFRLFENMFDIFYGLGYSRASICLISGRGSGSITASINAMSRYISGIGSSNNMDLKLDNILDASDRTLLSYNFDAILLIGGNYSIARLKKLQLLSGFKLGFFTNTNIAELLDFIFPIKTDSEVLQRYFLEFFIYIYNLGYRDCMLSIRAKKRMLGFQLIGNFLSMC
jgi:hypothetical protein